MTREEKNILTNFLKFGDKEVKDVMIHRTEIGSVSVKSTLDELSKAIIARPHTRTIVYQDNIDNIVGFIHIKDLFKVIASGKKSSVKDIIRQPLLTASSTKLIDLLVEMRRKRTHMSIVVDEYGSTEGIATIEDIVEEIVGEIEDEHDSINSNQTYDYSIISDGVIITNARVPVEDIEEALGIELKTQDEDIDTIGGLIMVRTGHVPKTGDIIKVSENVVAEVLDANLRSIKRLKIIYNEEVED